MTEYWLDRKVLVTGGAGFLGSNIVECLKERGTRDIVVPRSAEFDLRERSVCDELVKGVDTVIHAAGDVGGIGYNQRHPGRLFYDNLVMGVNLIDAARKAAVGKFVAIGTVCAYPKNTPVPFKEEDLWSGYPEETNAPYGLAKKMLLVQCQAYRDEYDFNGIYLLPVNLYGPGDNFKDESSHVIPALIKRFVNARAEDLDSVEVWGTGRATREFLYVKDAAEAIVLAAEYYSGRDPINIGSSFEISIAELAELIRELTGFRGEIIWDTSKPDGQPKRKLDVTKAEEEFGFRSKIGFREGLKRTIDWYLKTNNIK